MRQILLRQVKQSAYSDEGKKSKMNDILQVGAVTSTHGLAGEVKVFPTTDDVKRFKKLKQCAIWIPGRSMLPLEI